MTFIDHIEVEMRFDRMALRTYENIKSTPDINIGDPGLMRDAVLRVCGFNIKKYYHVKLDPDTEVNFSGICDWTLALLAVWWIPHVFADGSVFASGTPWYDLAAWGLIAFIYPFVYARPAVLCYPTLLYDFELFMRAGELKDKYGVKL